MSRVGRKSLARVAAVLSCACACAEGTFPATSRERDAGASPDTALLDADPPLTADATAAWPIVDPPPPHSVYALDDEGALVEFYASRPDRVRVRTLILPPGERARSIAGAADSVAAHNFRAFVLSWSGRVYPVDLSRGTSGADRGAGTPDFQLDEASRWNGFASFARGGSVLHVTTDTGFGHLSVLPLEGGARESRWLLTNDDRPERPRIVALGYVAPSSTPRGWGIDSASSRLVEVMAPLEAGRVRDVGPLGLTVEEPLGFGIAAGDPAPTEGFAIFRTGETNGFYRIDLARGTARLVARVAHDRPIRSLAIERL